MRFLPLTKADVEDVVAISKDAFKDGWNAQLLLDGIESGNLFGTICKIGNKTIAFITYSTNEEFAELNDIFVVQEYRKNGIASVLLQGLFDNLKGKTKKIFLEVREGNAPAISLYNKFGFTKVNVRRKYYADGENALVLVREN